MQSDWNQVITEAKEQIYNITLKDLTEIRAYASPPQKVFLCTQLLVLILTGEKKEWDGIKK